MDHPIDPGPGPAGWVPISACTLPTAEQPLRMTAFDELFATSLRAVERPPGAATRVRLVLSGGKGLRDRVQRLTDAEAACCSFFTFALTPLPGQDVENLALDVEVPAAHADVLAGLVARAERVAGSPA